MLKLFKKIVKKVLFILHIDITKNQQYDRQTLLVMKKVIKPDSNCIDIGCHKGEMLEIILRLSPNGKHMAFEPIPFLNNQLQDKYGKMNVSISNVALSNLQGMATFNHVVNAPAYSGLKQRKYAVKHPKIEEITVLTERLDAAISKNTKIDFIKLDVEGAEFSVLQGAVETLKRCKPVLIFEFGLGASDFYGTQPEEVFKLLNNECSMKIYLLKDWLNNSAPLTIEKFKAHYQTNSEYYFIAE